MEHQVSDLLVNTWAGMLTLILTVYVALDGFDLGVGMLSLVERDAKHQATMMNSLSGIWDANETWLVLLGGVLFGAFPPAYAAILQALYVPLLLMLFALVFRGVAFEFRLYVQGSAAWMWAFGIGSLLATLAQGLAVGALLGGMPLGSVGAPVAVFAWLTPMSWLAAVVLATAYVVLGACYLVGKVEGELREAAQRWAWRSTWALAVLLPIFLAGCAWSVPYVAERWAASPLWYGLLAVAMAVPFGLLLLSLAQGRDDRPFFWCLVALVMTVLGLVASHYPFLVPGALTLHMAASSTRTLEFMLYAVGTLLPLMLAYNGYQYYVFRGRVDGAGH